MGEHGKVRLLMHSIAFGNLKPIAPSTPDTRSEEAVAKLASALGVEASAVQSAVDDLLEQGVGALHTLQAARYGDAVMDEEDMARTIYAMGTSLLSWVQDLHRLGLFAADARVLGMTSEGNRSEERRVGKEGVSKCRSRWWPYH